MSNLAEYDGHKFFDASKEDLKIGKDKSEKSAEKKLRVQLVTTRTIRVLGLHSAPPTSGCKPACACAQFDEASPSSNWRCTLSRGSTRS